MVLPPGSAVDKSTPAGQAASDDFELASRKRTVAAINEATLTKELREFALKEVPFGLWQAKPECQQQLAGQKKVSDFASSPPDWMLKKNPDPKAPVYMGAPGATLYRHICFNCHGPKADGQGLQGDALRPRRTVTRNRRTSERGSSDLRPAPDANLMSTFSLDSTPEWTPRSVGIALHGLDGSGRDLEIHPDNIIHLVEATRVLGEVRQNLNFLPSGAESSFRQHAHLGEGHLRGGITGYRPAVPILRALSSGPASYNPPVYPPFNDPESALIGANGDKEMWLALCSRFSPRVVRVYTAGNLVEESRNPSKWNLIWRDVLRRWRRLTPNRVWERAGARPQQGRAAERCHGRQLLSGLSAGATTRLAAWLANQPISP